MKPDFNPHRRLRSPLTLSIIILVLSGGCATTSSTRQHMDPQSKVGAVIIRQQAKEYTIQPGDEVEISVWGYDEFNTVRTVTGPGYVTVPLVGEVQAQGLSKEQFKNTLKKALAEYIKGAINLTVTVTSMQEHIVSVLGSVGSPDNYVIIDEMNLFQILSKAGGTTEQADLRNIKIYRRGRPAESIEVDLTAYLEKKSLETVATVQPGDIVYVPPRENVVRELSGFFRDVALLFGVFRVLN